MIKIKKLMERQTTVESDIYDSKNYKIKLTNKWQKDNDEVGIVVFKEYDIYFKDTRKKVGWLKNQNYFNSTTGQLFGRNLPQLQRYGKGKFGDISSYFKAFVNSKTGKKWLSRSIKDLNKYI